MRKDKEKVFALRRMGRSYNEIRREIKIPKSTLSEWLSPHGWSKNIAEALTKEVQKKHTVRIRKLNKIRGKQLKRVYEEARQEALSEFREMKYHPLFIAGIMLYWGEGDRATRNGVRIANVDPAMIRLFKNFLFHVCQAPKERVKASLLIYPDLDDRICKRYWSKETGIKIDKFNKSVVIQGRHATRRLQYGVCNITFSSRYLKEKMLIWIDIFPKELLSEEYYKRV